MSNKYYFPKLNLNIYSGNIRKGIHYYKVKSNLKSTKYGLKIFLKDFYEQSTIKVHNQSIKQNKKIKNKKLYWVALKKRGVV